MIDHLEVFDRSGSLTRFRREPSPPDEPGVRYARVKHDYEVYGVSRPEYKDAPQRVWGLPETIKCADFIPLSKDWQFYWYSLLRKAAPPDMSEQDVIDLFGTITRRNAFKTNKHACQDGYANYVTGCNVGAKPIQTEVIVTGGAYLKILDYPNIHSSRGVPSYLFATLNIRNPPPDPLDWDATEQTPYIYFATTSGREALTDGTRPVIPLLGGCDIPVPNVADGDYALIRTDRIEILPSGAPPPRPYNP
jgi:hypothetical protein